MSEIPQVAKLIESALREHMRLKITQATIEHAQRGWPVHMSGGEAENATRIALDALTEAGLVVVPAEDYRHVLDRAEQFAMHRFDADDSILVARLRAALPEETDHA